ncbi:MAG: DUF1318 domain-containing protein [Planctomycetes bacterium]|nr:DUF1318 domain-containing protein [Planctomycetota bacterium]
MPTVPASASAERASRTPKAVRRSAALSRVAGFLALLVAFPSCTNVNRAIYFDGSRMEEAAGRILAEVRGAPTPAPEAAEGAPAAGGVDLRAVQLETPTILELRGRMKKRFPILVPLYDQSDIGEGKSGLVVLLRTEGLDANQRAGLEDLVAKENEDRMALYRAVVAANAYTDWQVTRIQTAFARKLRELARPGWRYQSPDGHWREQMEGVWPAKKPVPGATAQ